MCVNLTRFVSFMQSGRRRQHVLCSRPLHVNPIGLASSGALLGSHYNNLLRVVPRSQSRIGKGVISATARPMDVDVNDGSSVARDAENLVEAGVSWVDAFYRFTRPHTIYGSALGVISVSLLAIQSPADFTSTFFVGLLQVYFL